MNDDIELRRRLAVIWLNETSRHRYVPKATKAGPGWKVFDRKTKRMMKNRDVKLLTFEQCNETFLL